MKITGISYNSGTYTINLDTGDTITGKVCVAGNNTEVTEDFQRYIDDINWLTEDINDAHFIDQDEYLIVITKMYIIEPEDKYVHIGDMRYYITNHLDSTYFLSFDILNSTLENIDATEFQFALFSYLHWEI